MQNSFLPLPIWFSSAQTSKNAVLISQNVKESTAWKKKLIEHAQKSIELSGCYCGGKIFDRFLKLIFLRLRKQSKLQVRILSVKDLVTASNKRHIQKLIAEFPDRFHYLETSRRIQFFPQMKIFENHEKILVVDEKYFIVGGSNLSDECNRTVSEIKKRSVTSFIEWIIGIGMCDMDAVASGPLARIIRLEFYRLWAKWKSYQTQNSSLVNEYFALNDNLENIKIPEFDNSPRVICNVEMSFVSGSPEDGRENQCVKTMHYLFNHALKTIVIGSMVFNEDGLINSLSLATKRQVQVIVITNGNKRGENSLGKRALGIANRYNYSRLASDCAEFYEYDVPGQVYHKKVTVIDDKITVIGGMNISSKSVACDDESILVIYSQEVAEIMLKILAKDITHSSKVSREDIFRFRRGWHRIAGKVVSSVNKYKMN